jgi:aspartate dehydrogenase
MPSDENKVAVIGFGAMATSLANSLATRDDGPRIGATLIPVGHTIPEGFDIAIFHDVDALQAWRPSLVVECAGHESVSTSVPELLKAGIPVVIVSIGALADEGLRTLLEAAATTGGAALSIASGAIGGLDVLRSAKLAGLNSVNYRGVKPPAAWAGTPAETSVDLRALQSARVIFEGNAAEAASLYPKNANVTAAVALAGIGFEQTTVTLVADPHARSNSHHVEGVGAFGRFSISLENTPLPGNPKTSWLAALSVEQAVLRHFQPVKF